MATKRFIVLLIALISSALGAAAISAETTRPAEDCLALAGDTLSLNLPRLTAEWKVDGNTLRPATLTDAVAKQRYDLARVSLFKIQITRDDNTQTIDSSKLKLIDGVKIARIEPVADAVCLAERLAGWRATAGFKDDKSGVRFDWSCVARAGESYFRQKLTVTAAATDLPLTKIILLDHPLRFPWIDGTVAGSPIVAGTLFCGLEEPSATNEILNGLARGGLDRTVPLAAGQSITVSAVIGVARVGQLRRDFQHYLNEERPRPVNTFLHYNSWYDIGYFTPFNESDALGAINIIGQELFEKRGVKLSSYLFDDGWDNHKTLWDFNSGFPNGFTPLIQAAAKYNAGLGVWLSPWGGYGPPKAERLKNGTESGFEISDGGFALSGPKYYEHFRQACEKMVETFGVNQFKFDGTGNVASQYPGSKFGTDFDAMISLISDLRKLKPDLYVNLTTGTWPSPFWTRYADSIWRGGDDHTFAGLGTFRQRWITYRDGDEYHGIVQQGPLFPLNSLMLHGIIYAQHAHDLNTDPADDFADEVHGYFGTGTQLQEMYITGKLLTPQNWDTLAEAARWARTNAITLADSHWIGGDPTRGEVYGFAAWSPIKGILTLRNPSDVPQSIELDPAIAFELPNDAVRSFEAHIPWKGASADSVHLQVGKAHHFDLKPFQTLILEAMPAK